MCTVSWLPAHMLEGVGDCPVRLRVVFNRDEQRTRLPASPPDIVSHGDRRVLMPRDADGGGTWIAANDVGVIFTLLNVNAGSHAVRRERADLLPYLRTRGDILGHLVEGCTASDALERTHAIDPRAFRPFRAIACDRQGAWMEFTWTGVRIHRCLRRLDAPRMRTSSGLGDAVVIGERRRLFHTFLKPSGASNAAAQDAFHRHHWTDAAERSVLMNRADARTVSITTVEVMDAGVRMLYHQLPDTRSARDITARAFPPSLRERQSDTSPAGAYASA